ncbi:MAG: sodium:calcium antiporter, partial [Bacteroidota bacterium]
MLIWVLLLVVTLYGLVKSSALMIRSAEHIGLSFGASPFVVGVLLLPLGTSMPELITSLTAISEGQTQIIMGSVVGSTLANTLLILGVVGSLSSTTIIFKIKHLHTDLFFLMGAVMLLGFFIADHQFSPGEGLVAITGFLGYLTYIATNNRSILSPDLERMITQTPEAQLPGNTLQEHTRRASWRSYLLFVASAGVLYVSADYAVKSVVKLSEYINVDTEVIATSAVALGMSLPELIVSVNAMRTRQPEMALGNILGASVFNILLVAGLSSLFGDLHISDYIRNEAYFFVLVGALFFYWIVSVKRLNRFDGYI